VGTIQSEPTIFLARNVIAFSCTQARHITNKQTTNFSCMLLQPHNRFIIFVCKSLRLYRNQFFHPFLFRQWFKTVVINKIITDKRQVQLPFLLVVGAHKSQWQSNFYSK